jgi:hypothetical protein
MQLWFNQARMNAVCDVLFGDVLWLGKASPGASQRKRALTHAPQVKTLNFRVN